MKISFANGPRKGESVALQPPGVCIGRESDNDIQLLLAGISRYHAKISFDGIKWSLQDLGSTNGTKVNGKLITAPVDLQPGDEVVLGDQVLLFGDQPVDPHKLETLKNMQPPIRQAQTVDPQERTVKNEPSQAVKITPLQPVELKKIPKPEPKKESAGAKKEKAKPSPPQLGKINIFAKKEEAPPPEAEVKETGKRKHVNMKLIFPVLVISLALIVVALFIRMNFMAQEEKPIGDIPKAKPDFLVHYERSKTDPDNVFRFEFTLENGKATFVLDDLKYGREFRKTFDNINPVYLQNLEESVRATDFLKLRQEPMPELLSGKSDEKRRLTVAVDNKINTISIRNAYAQSSFENIERAIERFAGDNGISTVSMNINEMRKYAFDTFRKAEDLYANYQAKPENLREAIKRYQLAMEYLDQFTPKPQEWDTARKRLIEARKIYKRVMDEFSYNISRYRSLNQFDKASAECQKAMDTVEPGSEAYYKLKRYKLVFDKQRRK